MHCWALQGRQLLNQDLWDTLKPLLQSCFGVTLWKHVCSHIGVLGNERVDTPAN